MAAAPIPVAVVGVGHMGRHHARIYSELPGCRLAAVIDRDRPRAQEIADKHGGVPLDSIDAMPAEVAAASVAVPTTVHLAVAEALIARGVAVLVEKPLAPSVADAERLCETARRSKVLLAVGHTERFNPAVRALQRLEIEPKFIETDRISPFTFRSADVSVVHDMMIHDIDILLHLVARGGGTAPQVQSVHAVGVAVLGRHEDVVNARVAFDNGAVANLTASRLALKTERRLRVFSPEAYLSVDYHRKTGIAIVKDRNLDIFELAARGGFDDLSQMKDMDFGKMVKVEPLLVDDVEPLRAELESFIDCVRTGRTPAVSGDDGVAAMRLADQIVESARAHRWDAGRPAR